MPRLHKPGELKDWVRKLSIPGVADSVVGNILGVDRKTVQATRKRFNIPPGVILYNYLPFESLSTDAKFLHLYAGVGKSDSQIASILNVDYGKVRRTRERFGLPALGSAGTTKRDNWVDHSGEKRTVSEPKIYTIRGEM